MNSMSTTSHDPLAARATYLNDTCSSGVAWGAIIGGAFAAASVSLILLTLGSAMGLSSLSPWSHSETITSFSVKTVVWLVVMQWVASGVGGYLTGRLRTKWVGVHTDEVFFRDTANGFLAWAVATLLMASLLASAVSAVLSGGVQASATVAAGAAAGAAGSAAQESKRFASDYNDPMGYYVDSLFRSPVANPGASAENSNVETTRILIKSVKEGGISDADKAYLAQVVSARAGVDQAEATKRVDNVIGQLNAVKDKAKQNAEVARKAAMHVSLYLSLSLLVGAFIASAAAAVGGKRRDE